MGNSFSSSKDFHAQVHPEACSLCSRTEINNVTSNATSTKESEIQVHPIASSPPSRTTCDSNIPNVIGSDTGLFNKAQNIFVTGSNFIEVNGNYVCQIILVLYLNGYTYDKECQQCVS
jgi:hypothetical protein